MIQSLGKAGSESGQVMSLFFHDINLKNLSFALCYSKSPEVNVILQINPGEKRNSGGVRHLPY